MLKYFFAALSIGCVATAAAQSTAAGYVFVDANDNGRMDKQETGIAGVAVSNGKDFSITDARGRYELPVGNDNIIFVVKPKGYRFKNNQHNLPQYYHIHKPQGSPQLKHKGVSPTGALSKDLNFALYKYDEPTDFTVLVFGDPQPYNEQELGYFSKSIVDDVAADEAIKFGISLGDIVGDDLSLHEPYKQVMTKLNLPWYNVMGNHDMNYDATADSLSDETFERNFGPNNFSWNYGNAHFIILDNILYPDPRDGKGYWGGLRPDQIEFIKNDLAQVATDKLIVVSFHIPFSNEGGEAIRLEDRQAFFDLLKDYDNCLLLSAHTHFQKQIYYKAADGWHGKKAALHEYNVGTTSGDWYSGELNQAGIPDGTMRDGTPRGYAFLKISDNDYALRYKVAGKDSSYQIQIYAPQIVGHNSRGSAPFYANFFMGAQGDKVQYKIDNGKWQAMKYEPTFDYSYLKLVTKWDDSKTLLAGRRPSAPVASEHIWSAVVNKKLAPGEHQLHVRAEDKYGNIYHQTHTYKIQ
ncbi:calcineurin-like phosphoesterase family protein [Niabella insulamsoli]|uniref:calcineurin-like phosphoesterase family protein n=1 Tax=Niabella insulamsoli TaxID=3144874 RepID=UPI0031FC1FA6